MNLVRYRQAAAMVTALLLIPVSFAQAPGGDKVDLDALAQIKTEAFEHSQVMENLSWIRQIPWQAEGQGAADVRPGSTHAPHAGGRAALPDG